VVRGNVAKISLVYVELQPGSRLQSHCQKITAHACTRRRHLGIAAGAVYLQRVVDGQIPFVENSVLQENEGAIDIPLEQCDAHPRRAGVAEIVKGSALEVDESTTNPAVRVVIP